MTIPGLSYIPDFIDAETHDALVATIDAELWSGVLARRRVQQHGHSYDYHSRKVTYLGPLPPWAATIAARLLAEGTTPRLCDQLIVNEYEPGRGISAHID